MGNHQLNDEAIKDLSACQMAVLLGAGLASGADLAGGADEAGSAVVFRVRPATVSETHPDLRYYGGREEIADARGVAVSSAEVMRHAEDDMAHVRIRIGYGTSTSMGMVGIRLRPEGLRALAHRLIDAAADIDANPASALLAAESAREGAAA